MKKLVRLYIALALLLALAPQLIGPALAAWPLTRRTTYVANSTPVIKAADLNAMQDVVGDMLIGNLSYKGLVIDGTGGAAVSSVAGSVKISRSTAGTVLPATTAEVGEVTKGSLSIGWGQVNGSGTVAGVHNVNSVSRIGTGQYRIVLNVAPTSTARMAVTALPINTAAVTLWNTTGTSIGAGKLTLEINTYAMDGTTLINAPFSFAVYGD